MSGTPGNPKLHAIAGGSGGGGAASPPPGGDGVNREELHLHLALNEARQETKFVTLIGEVKQITTAVGGLQISVRELQEDNKNTRLTIWVTAIGSVLAIVGVLLAAQSNMLSAFQTGLTVVSTVSPPSAAPAPQSPQGTGAGKPQ